MRYQSEIGMSVPTTPATARSTKPADTTIMSITAHVLQPVGVGGLEGDVERDHADRRPRPGEAGHEQAGDEQADAQRHRHATATPRPTPRAGGA